MIDDVISQDSVSATGIDILSGSIVGEAKQVAHTSLAVTHLEDALELFARNENETLDNIDEEDVYVS